MRYKCVGEVIFCDEWTEQKWQFSKVAGRQFLAVCDEKTAETVRTRWSMGESISALPKLEEAPCSSILQFYKLTITDHIQK